MQKQAYRATNYVNARVAKHCPVPSSLATFGAEPQFSVVGLADTN
jgi:hypothetical protein